MMIIGKRVRTEEDKERGIICGRKEERKEGRKERR